MPQKAAPTLQVLFLTFGHTEGSGGDRRSLAGADLAIAGREIATLREQAALVEGLGRRCLPIELDVAETGRLAGMVDAVVAHFGRLDALVNNASAFHATPIGEASEHDWDELFASNAKAPFFLAQAAAPHLRASQGAIVNLVDIYAERPLARHTIYCMAKAALQMLTLSLARELGPEVRVNGIAPGAVLWPESGKPYTDQQALIDATALRRAGDPQDVADAALFLLRDARYTTGHVLRVDGGRTLSI